MKQRKKLLTILALATLAIPISIQAQAGLIINNNYPHSALKERGICSNEKDCRKLGIYLNDGKKGIKVNYENEQELVTKLTQLYIKNTTPENLPSTAYFISEDPEFKGDQPATFFDTMGLFDSLNFDGHKRAYQKIETLIESDDFQSCIERKGEDKCFIQGINPKEKKNIGFFNYQGNQIK